MKTPKKIYLVEDHEDPDYIVWQADQPAHATDGVEYTRSDTVDKSKIELIKEKNIAIANRNAMREENAGLMKYIKKHHVAMKNYDKTRELLEEACNYSNSWNLQTHLGGRYSTWILKVKDLLNNLGVNISPNMIDKHF